MNTRQAQRIEWAADAAAAAVLAIATGACALRLSMDVGMVVMTAALALCCSFALLRAVRPNGSRFGLAEFALADLPAPPDELLLTDADRLPNQPEARSAELLLDDVLAELGPDSRVVRLFDRTAMPTPGELRPRIDRHLDSGRSSAPIGDASQALHEALAELRRSIR
jgi:hypothetical protein